MDDAETRADRIAEDTLIAVVLNRYPTAQLIEMQAVSDNYYDGDYVPAILDSSSELLWLRNMIGPVRESDLLFTDLLDRYTRQITRGTDRVTVELPKPRMRPIFGWPSVQCALQYDVYGILILS